MRLWILCLLIIIHLHACVAHSYTAEGGIRVQNSKVFKYNKERHRSRDKSPIDTEVIYRLDSSYDKYQAVKGIKNKPGAYMRFFSTGQVLFFYDTSQTIQVLNNRKTGRQGYYFIKGDRIKIDRFELINGGQTGKYYGRILDDGSLLFYEQRPGAVFGSFSALERDGRMSFWKKLTVPAMERYTPDW
ncbi:hypothetical protein [Flavihumibacter sp. CACIAM 22H1]|uniref:hypothetical protein n=1 Tax=Flavihumibacter sp. CACIAM 22H1 TaxID=1812911 RepID=UPI0007A9120D|nr:hypothetical protein [Flavihumibacter sp. CACIAM 22H1]KYP14122.1 MAG: hypothetical protein A1D16_19925 [Flavihumibacter sp. CACIAM 22H1]